VCSRRSLDCIDVRLQAAIGNAIARDLTERHEPAEPGDRRQCSRSVPGRNGRLAWGEMYSPKKDAIRLKWIR
jgi:hypothetical protein